MAKLGRCLVFYLKYPAQMNWLYSQRSTGKKPGVDGLPDKDKVLSMIDRVGDAACRDAAAFLETCAEQIEPRLQSIGVVSRVGSSPKRDWTVKWWLSAKKHPERSFEVGVYIDETPGEIVPWIWCRGGRRAEDAIVRILGRGIKARSSDFSDWPGTVALDRINVAIPKSLLDFDVEQDPLVEKVRRALNLKTDDVKALTGITPRRGE